MSSGNAVKPSIAMKMKANTAQEKGRHPRRQLDQTRSKRVNVARAELDSRNDGKSHCSNAKSESDLSRPGEKNLGPTRIIKETCFTKKKIIIGKPACGEPRFHFSY